MPDDQRHYGQWSKEELHQAEAAAVQFLEENSARIAETMQAKAGFLQELIRLLARKEIVFEERLEHFARASEVARLIQADADGFFDLASQPQLNLERFLLFYIFLNFWKPHLIFG